MGSFGYILRFWKLCNKCKKDNWSSSPTELKKLLWQGITSLPSNEKDKLFISITNQRLKKLCFAFEDSSIKLRTEKKSLFNLPWKLVLYATRVKRTSVEEIVFCIWTAGRSACWTRCGKAKLLGSSPWNWLGQKELI